MKLSDCIRDILKNKKINQKDFASMLGLKSQSGVSSRLNDGVMRVSSLMEMADALGYDVVLKPKNGKGESYTITNEE